jgi:hypothetical protein
MTYSLWSNNEDSFYTFVEGNTSDELECTILLKTVEADSWNEAMQKFYDFLGWGTFKP